MNWRTGSRLFYIDLRFNLIDLSYFKIDLLL
jgi:hypothetical protein